MKGSVPCCPVLLLSVPLISHTSPTEIRVARNQTPHPGGRKSNFTNHTHNRLFMQVGRRVVRCVSMFGTLLQVVNGHMCCPRAFPQREANMHAHPLLGVNGEACVWGLSFNRRPSVSHSPEEHPWVLLSLTHMHWLSQNKAHWSMFNAP